MNFGLKHSSEKNVLIFNTDGKIKPRPLKFRLVKGTTQSNYAFGHKTIIRSLKLIATMQNRFLKLDIFSISVLLDRLFVTHIGGSDRFS